MARYADIDKFMQNLETDEFGFTDAVKVGIAFDKSRADAISKEYLTRKEDEAYERGYAEAKSEVEKWKEINEQLHKEMCERNLEERKIERKLVAREIFEEIENKKIFLKDHAGNMGVVVMLKDIAELKKKYTEDKK